MENIRKRIAEMCASVDTDPAIPAGDEQWRKGYKQAGSDIIAVIEDDPLRQAVADYLGHLKQSLNVGPQTKLPAVEAYHLKRLQELISR